MPEYSRVEAVLSIGDLDFGNMNRLCLARMSTRDQWTSSLDSLDSK